MLEAMGRVQPLMGPAIDTEKWLLIINEFYTSRGIQLGNGHVVGKVLIVGGRRLAESHDSAKGSENNHAKHQCVLDGGRTVLVAEESKGLLCEIISHCIVFFAGARGNIKWCHFLY